MVWRLEKRENVLCAPYATARGGWYDDERDEWKVTLPGLSDEAYGPALRETKKRESPGPPTRPVWITYSRA
jgi:hypothetical protein